MKLNIPLKLGLPIKGLVNTSKALGK